MSTRPKATKTPAARGASLKQAVEQPKKPASRPMTRAVRTAGPAKPAPDGAAKRAVTAATPQPQDRTPLPLPEPAAKPVKPPKLKKPKPVRDSFTMPRAEYELIELLKRRAHIKGHKVKKSELLRAGILALADMSDAQLFAAIAAVPVIKTGRPSAVEPLAAGLQANSGVR